MSLSLQEAFKTPVLRVDGVRLTLSHIVPDLLFADLPPELLFRSKVSSPDRFLVSMENHLFSGVSPPPTESTGMCVDSYYSFDDDDVFVRKPAGVLKAVSYRVALVICQCNTNGMCEVKVK